MNYRILTFALVILFAGCEMATEPTLDASEDGKYAVSGSALDAARQSNVDAAEHVSDNSGKSERGMTLARARAASAKYHRLEAALADGYFAPDPDECVSSPDGAMGVHFVRPDILFGDDDFEITMPEVLVYEPQKNGRMRLVAIEYVVFREEWDASHEDPPSLLGEPFHESFGEASHGLADHYEIHVWLWRHNPNGMFAMWNPKVTCP